jgi:hypothetical protein
MSDDAEKKIEKEENKKTSSTPHLPICSVVPESSERVKDKVIYLEMIKSCWTHEPWLYFKVVIKSNEEMGDYIALHGLVPQNELPLHLRYKIPENEIWIRENIYADIQRRRSILAHEYAELDLMISHAMCYKDAHEHAEFFEHLFYHE